jgi:hypothetical protein
MTNPHGLFGHNFSSVLSQLQLAADPASLAVSKLISAAPRPHDAAGFTHVCTGANASVSAATAFLGDPNEAALEIHGHVVALRERVHAVTANMSSQELASPKGRKLKRFSGWKMLVALGQPGVSNVCLIAGGLLLMWAWHTDRKISKAQSVDVTREAQRCDLSVEGLRLLLESEIDAADTGYPWLGQLQRNWPKLLNLFTVGGGNGPPTPPSFTHRARGQLLAAAEHASMAHRAGTPDYRHLSEGQFKRACQHVAEWNAVDDWHGVFAETGAQSRLSADLLGSIPLASAMPESWIVAIDARQGHLQTDCTCVAADAAAAPSSGDVVPSGFVSTTSYSAAAAASLRGRLLRYPDAKTLGDLYPEAPALAGENNLYESTDEIRPSWSRWTNSFGLHMRRAGHDNFLSATTSNDFGHIPRSKLYYASVSREEIWAATNSFYMQIGWGGAEPSKGSGIGFGCRVVPTMDAVRAASAWQLQKMTELRLARRSKLATLLEFHNRYARVVALRLAALLGLREDTAYELWADIDERVDLWVELLDKVVTGARGALPVALCKYARSLISQYRKHCDAMAWRLQTIGQKDTPFQLWLLEVAGRERVRLLCMASDVAQIRPLGSGDVIGQLPPQHALAPDFGRKLLENQMRCLTSRPAEEARKFALRSSDIDAVLRHEVHGQWRYASSSDFVLIDWLRRVIPVLEVIAADAFGDVPSGLSKE